MENLDNICVAIIGFGIGFLSLYYKLPWFITLVISLIVLSLIGLIVILTGV